MRGGSPARLAGGPGSVRLPPSKPRLPNCVATSLQGCHPSAGSCFPGAWAARADRPSVRGPRRPCRKSGLPASYGRHRQPIIVSVPRRWMRQSLRLLLGYRVRYGTRVKSVVLTTSWDDGHRSDLRLARMLSEYGLKATFYISPQNHEFAGSDLLTPQEIRDLSCDFEIGAH